MCACTASQDFVHHQGREALLHIVHAAGPVRVLLAQECYSEVSCTEEGEMLNIAAGGIQALLIALSLIESNQRCLCQRCFDGVSV